MVAGLADQSGRGAQCGGHVWDAFRPYRLTEGQPTRLVDYRRFGPAGDRIFVGGR